MPRLSVLVGTVLPILFAASAPAQDQRTFLVTEDAERFIRLYEAHDGAPPPEVLQADYIDAGTRGVEIFTPYRIEDGKNMAATITGHGALYGKAIALCYPQIDPLREELQAILAGVAEVAQADEIAPLYIVFGANNSGGTAAEDGMVLGLEVVCRDVETADGFRDELLDIAAHETVHSYQFRYYEFPEGGPSLLAQSILEGTADFIAELVTGREFRPDIRKWAAGREAALWHEFLEDHARGEADNWLYNVGQVTDRPEDIGYWIGSKIAWDYYNQAENKQQAIADLLALEDPGKILRESGYSPE